MKEYTITRCNGMPDWNTVPAAQINELYNTAPTDITAQAQVCYDEEALYVHLSTKEKEIRAEYFGPLDEVSDDSCLEFFFAPMAGDRRYMNIEFNFNGAMYLGFGSGPSDLIRLVPERKVIDPIVNKTEDGWEITYTVPYSYIRQFFPDFKPRSGYTTRANFYKCTGAGEGRHFLCWSLVVKQTWSFHNFDRFGTVHFE